jgi:hypothetical protein
MTVVRRRRKGWDGSSDPAQHHIFCARTSNSVAPQLEVRPTKQNCHIDHFSEMQTCDVKHRQLICWTLAEQSIS